jgi:hypothetical protein
MRTIIYYPNGDKTLIQAQNKSDMTSLVGEDYTLQNLFQRGKVKILQNQSQEGLETNPFFSLEEEITKGIVIITDKNWDQLPD